MKSVVQAEPRVARANAEVAQTRNFVTPEVDIFETKEGYVLEAEMPGVSKEGLEVTLEGNELTIVGHRQVVGTNGEALICECSRADYRRVFELDPAIDTGRISARMNQGILTLTLPRSEAQKPRKVKVD